MKHGLNRVEINRALKMLEGGMSPAEVGAQLQVTEECIRSVCGVKRTRRKKVEEPTEE